MFRASHISNFLPYVSYSISAQSAVRSSSPLFSLCIFQEKHFSRITSSPLPPLLATQSNQHVSLRQHISLLRRAKAVSHVVKEHFSASTHSVLLSAVSNRMTVTPLSLAPLFTQFCPSFSRQRSLQKTFSFSLLWFLQSAPARLLSPALLSCMEARTYFFLHRNKRSTWEVSLSAHWSKKCSKENKKARNLRLSSSHNLLVSSAWNCKLRV